MAPESRRLSHDPSPFSQRDVRRELCSHSSIQPLGSLPLCIQAQRLLPPKCHSRQRGQVEARHLWAKIKGGSRESLAEEQRSPLLAQRAPPADSEALDELAAQLKGHISTQTPRGQVLRIRDWEERIRRAWLAAGGMCTPNSTTHFDRAKAVFTA